jgi:predicted ribosome quality control (RQC) complex YloA/Tae2 family protein
MDEITLQAVTEEVTAALRGGIFVRLWQIGRASFVLDIRNEAAPFLFVCAEAAAPRLYLAHRRARDLERSQLAPQGFALTLRRQLAGLPLVDITKDSSDRIVRLRFQGRNEIGEQVERVLVAQLTGRAANLLLLDEKGFVRDALRQLQGAGQEIGASYAPPIALQAAKTKPPLFSQDGHETLSQAADNYYSQLEAARAAAAQAANLRQKITKEINQRQRLLDKLAGELTAHGDAERHKLNGDILLANLQTAQREGGQVLVTDYFAPDAPRITLEIDPRHTLPEAAARFFKRYGKAKRAAAENAKLSAQLEAELVKLRENLAALEERIAAGETLEQPAESGVAQTKTPDKGKSKDKFRGARYYLSADGWDILVGRAAKDNDYLTFRLAGPHDWWFHAADYPGSHVVARNPARGEMPPRTLLEAAQLAAFYSQAKNMGKADVRYTQRKFLSKPKGGAPGLARLSQFKTITVTPSETAQRNET